MPLVTVRLPVTSPNADRFLKTFFTIRLSSKSVRKSYLQCTPHSDVLLHYLVKYLSPADWQSPMAHSASLSHISTMTEIKPQSPLPSYTICIMTVRFSVTVCKTVLPILLYRCPVLSVTLVYCGQTVGRIKMKLGVQVGLGHIVLDGDPAPPQKRGTAPNPILSPWPLWPNGWMD